MSAARGRILATCPKGHALARTAAIDGEAAISLQAAVAGKAKGTEARGGKFEIAADPTVLPFAEIAPDAVNVFDVYCGHCHRNFQLDLNAMMRKAKDGGSPDMLTF